MWLKHTVCKQWSLPYKPINRFAIQSSPLFNALIVPFIIVSITTFYILSQFQGTIHPKLILLIHCQLLHLSKVVTIIIRLCRFTNFTVIIINRKMSEIANQLNNVSERRALQASPRKFPWPKFDIVWVYALLGWNIWIIVSGCKWYKLAYYIVLWFV